MQLMMYLLLVKVLEAPKVVVGCDGVLVERGFSKRFWRVHETGLAAAVRGVGVDEARANEVLRVAQERATGAGPSASLFRRGGLPLEQWRRRIVSAMDGGIPNERQRDRRGNHRGRERGRDARRARRRGDGASEQRRGGARTDRGRRDGGRTRSGRSRRSGNGHGADRVESRLASAEWCEHAREPTPFTERNDHCGDESPSESSSG